MKILSKPEVAAAAPYDKLVAALRKAFAGDVLTPPRHHHELSQKATFLLMPAWTGPANPDPAYAGLKAVMVMPDNPARGLPTIQATYTLYSAETGETLAIMDGTEITARRTPAASALAASYLARPDAHTLLMVGAGVLGPHAVRAHAAVRPIKRVLVHNRSAEKSAALVQDLAADGFAAEAVDAAHLAEAANAADIISCATTSSQPIIKGAWLKPGTHIDLMGAFKPSMREVDGEAVGRARVYVDTYEGAETEAGDLLQAAAEGHFSMDRVAGDLAELCRGSVEGRRNSDEITLFKSCGTALEDLAAAIMIYESMV